MEMAQVILQSLLLLFVKGVRAKPACICSGNTLLGIDTGGEPRRDGGPRAILGEVEFTVDRSGASSRRRGGD
jgi:hypothetical protein